MIIAVHLLFLLSTNKTQEFYTKLESIITEQLKDDYIDYVLLLNDAIEEGNYRKVFSLREQNPLPEYFGAFLDRILETIRIEIAKSAEKAYAELSLKEALSIFEFKSVDQLRSFVNEYHNTLEEIQINWLFKDSTIVFERETNKKIKFNSEENIKRTLEYTLELERIA
jgi:26S proteasome regulatory subunit N12